MRKYCNSTDIHPRRQTDGSMVTEKPSSSPARCRERRFNFNAFLQRRGSRSFHEANSNINMCTSKINRISHTYTIGMIKMDMGQRFRCVMETSVLFNAVINTNVRTDKSLKGIIHGCFQVCKHVISCILQCAIRDHLGHKCCKLKHLLSRGHTPSRDWAAH